MIVQLRLVGGTDVALPQEKPSHAERKTPIEVAAHYILDQALNHELIGIYGLLFYRNKTKRVFAGDASPRDGLVTSLDDIVKSCENVAK
jgi:hypothetical protein